MASPFASQMPASISDTDAEDLRLASQADVEELYRRYSVRTLAFLSSMGVRGADADDIHQRVWMRVLESLRKKQFDGHFRGWLFQIVRNAAIDAMKKKRPEPLDASVAEVTLSVDAAPYQSMIDAEYRDALANCLQQLADDQQKIVRSRLTGDGYQVVAKTLGITTARAHRIFFDAKQSLATCLGKSSAGVPR